MPPAWAEVWSVRHGTTVLKKNSAFSVADDLGSTGQIHKQLKDLPDGASVVIDFTD